MPECLNSRQRRYSVSSLRNLCAEIRDIVLSGDTDEKTNYLTSLIGIDTAEQFVNALEDINKLGDKPDILPGINKIGEIAPMLSDISDAIRLSNSGKPCCCWRFLSSSKKIKPLNSSIAAFASSLERFNKELKTFLATGHRSEEPEIGIQSHP